MRNFSPNESNDLPFKVKIWGDEQFKYTGEMENHEGFSPGILLKLGSDKQIFINLKIKIKKGEEESEKEYVTFVSIPKRYQVEPTIKVDSAVSK